MYSARKSLKSSNLSVLHNDSVGVKKAKDAQTLIFSGFFLFSKTAGPGSNPGTPADPQTQNKVFADFFTYDGHAVSLW